MAMNWIKVKNVSPNSERKVLLGAFGEVPHYAIGVLGGCKNAPEIAVEGEGGRRFSVSATHWCELTEPSTIGGQHG